MSESIDVGAKNLVIEQAVRKAGRIIYNLLIVSIILATLPIGMASTVFSALFILLFLRPHLLLQKTPRAFSEEVDQCSHSHHGTFCNCRLQPHARKTELRRSATL
jgi:hypothetical protein